MSGEPEMRTFSAPSEPTIVRDADGTCTLHLPPHPAPSYPVATELFQQWVDTINENVRLRAEIRHHFVTFHCERDGLDSPGRFSEGGVIVGRARQVEVHPGETILPCQGQKES